MSLSLDFRQISTWEKVNVETACLRISSNEPENMGYNPGALNVSIDIFKSIKDKKKRAQFFLNCENLGLRSWKFFYAYKYHCEENQSKFIQAVLKSDEAMMQVVAQAEKDRTSS